MSSQKGPFEIFLSYARVDNQPIPPDYPHGWVTALHEQILADHRRFSTEPLRIFFDTKAIRDMDDWRHRILDGLRHSKILLVCLSPAYFASEYCRWEWEEYVRRQVHQRLGSDSVAVVYFVEVPGSDEQDNARRLEELTRGTFTDLRRWFPAGAAALRKKEVQRRVAVLGQSLWERIERARRALAAPGNLRRQNPYFVGRRQELGELHEKLAVGSIGVVTAVHGLGGQGKTELAVAYAHLRSDAYPGGLWVVAAERKRELLPLIGELAFQPEMNYQPTDAERADGALLGRGVLAELKRRVERAQEADPAGGRSALVILDNVSEPSLLAPVQFATLPEGMDWVRLLATTRLGEEQLHPQPNRQTLALVAVDSLAEGDALALVRDHQPKQRFSSPAEEEAARGLVRVLGGFTLAVEQVAVYLGLHPEIAPSQFAERLRADGLPSADDLPGEAGVAAQILHQGKQLAPILEATLAALEPAAHTALEFAAHLPPDVVPWPWLRELVVARHHELAKARPGYPDPWQEIRRRLEGLRLLTSSGEIARLHRLVGTHVLRQSRTSAPRRRGWLARLLGLLGGPMEPDVAPTSGEVVWSYVACFMALRASAFCEFGAQNPWELDALIVAMPRAIIDGSRDGAKLWPHLAVAAAMLSKVAVHCRGVSEARALLRPAHDALQKRANAAPGDVQAQLDLSSSYSALANVNLQQGKLYAAKKFSERALEICRRLASSDPALAEVRRYLMDSYTRLGDVNEQLGNLAAARTFFEQGLQIARDRFQADAANPQAERDLAVSYQKLGDLSFRQGAWAAAREFYRRHKDARWRLWTADPQNSSACRDVWVGFHLLALVIVAEGNLDAARKSCEQLVDVSRMLAQGRPADAQAQRDLAFSYEMLGGVNVKQKDFGAADERYLGALEIRRRLADADPANSQLQRDLLYVCGSVGNMCKQLGELNAAKDSYGAAYAIAERLADADPANAQAQRDLCEAYLDLALVLEESGDEREAAARYMLFMFKVKMMVDRGIDLGPELKRRILLLKAKFGQ